MHRHIPIKDYYFTSQAFKLMKDKPKVRKSGLITYRKTKSIQHECTIDLTKLFLSLGDYFRQIIPGET
jgi:hypothetical protein